MWNTTLDDLDVRIVETARGPVEVATAGRGPAVLLLHGIPGSWRQCIALAEDLADGFTTIMPSRPGYGNTPVSVGRTYDEQADAQIALLDALGIDRCAVFGISGGGPAAIAAAARHHDRISALVMACAMAPHLMKIPRGMRTAIIPAVSAVLSPILHLANKRRVASEKKVDAELAKSLTKAEYSTATAEPVVRNDLIRHFLSHMEAPSGVHGLRVDLECATAALAAGPPRFDVRAPALLLYGGSDEVIPLEHGRFYSQALGGAELVWFEDAGHVFALTRRAESSAAIRSFLERHAT